ncbi:Nuf2 family-domain-containing protein [Cyathus striatus]|nr:Nuf2 family-domain-containing protein [Cyathus striatus]
MAKGIFPQMPIPDIITTLADWGLSVSQEQLVRPTSDFVEGIYCACLQQITGLSSEMLRDPLEDVISASTADDKELYTAALTSNILLYHLARVAKAARVDDFNAKDLHAPERERTLVVLSAFINFIRFTEQYCNAFVNELRERSQALIAEREHVTEQLSQLQRAIHEIKAKMAEDEPKCEELRKVNDAMFAKLIFTKDIQQSAVHEVENLKEEKNTLIKRKELINDEITSISDAISRTRSRIVQSPERIKRTITTMSVTAIEDKKMLALQEAKTRDLQAKINTLLNVEKDVRGCVEQLQTIEKEVRSLQDIQKDLSELKDHLDEKNIERSELQLRYERVEKQLANAYDKLERAQKHAEDKKLGSQRTIERLQREYDEMVVERRDNDRQVEELRAEANAVEAKMSEHLKKNEGELNELLAEYWRLRHETGKYGTFSNAWWLHFSWLDVYMETLANKLNMRVIAE